MSEKSFDLTRLGEQIVAASSLPATRKGMKVSLEGMLRNAAIALRKMAEPADDATEEQLEEHEERCFRMQPQAQAFALEELLGHLGQLRQAVASGDTATVREFFDIYGSV
ncbi:hypothetical protein BSFA1_80300 (plasmid) [Burkholderia sp. SFA1]|nr:hypothetical protein BYI23_E001300 [Burkholderia sp. YI23]MCB4350044.1 hypothetical protein [Burkholderia vietnamiensis]BBQ02902.1 hypothetical protein BSFA1_80300 [Burkholderia sp. SFA1]